MRKGITLYTHGLLWLIGGCAYVLLELLWRGRSHWSMLVVGGTCFECIGQISRRFRRLRLSARASLCALTVTAIEFVSGCILNVWLGMGVWDYSGMRFHLKGQVCLLYTVLWGLLSVAVCPLYAVCYRFIYRFVCRGRYAAEDTLRS